MSPVDELGAAKVIRDKDSFFRNERGLLAMGHLIAFIASMVGIAFAATAVYGFLARHPDWPQIGQYAVGLLLAGASLEYGQTRLESSKAVDNLRGN